MSILSWEPRRFFRPRNDHVFSAGSLLRRPGIPSRTCVCVHAEQVCVLCVFYVLCVCVVCVLCVCVVCTCVYAEQLRCGAPGCASVLLLRGWGDRPGSPWTCVSRTARPVPSGRKLLRRTQDAGSGSHVEVTWSWIYSRFSSGRRWLGVQPEVESLKRALKNVTGRTAYVSLGLNFLIVCSMNCKLFKICFNSSCLLYLVQIIGNHGRVISLMFLVGLSGNYYFYMNTSFCI